MFQQTDKRDQDESSSSEDEYNNKNLIIQVIQRHKVIAVCNASVSESVIVGY